jgi:hypothetical protein
VSGYLRLYAEHWENAGGGSNPRHMMEIHPALVFDCGDGNVLDVSHQLTVFTGMRQIQGRSLERCFERLSLEVRSQNAGYDVRFNHPPQCGNFAIVRAVFDREDIEEMDGGHVVNATVFACEQALGRAARFYTYSGTSADGVVNAIRVGASPKPGMNLHAMLTYDWDSILTAVSTQSGNWATISSRKAVEQPLEFVVFEETK